MSLPRWVASTLEAEHVPFRIRHHRPVFTAQEVAAAEHVSGHRLAKVVVVMADEELTFPYKQWARFQSLEDGNHEVLLDPRAVQAEYLARLEQFLRSIDKACGQMQVDYVPMNTREPYAVALSNFLANRAARRR